MPAPGTPVLFVKPMTDDELLLLADVPSSSPLAPALLHVLRQVAAVAQARVTLGPSP